MEVCDGMRSPGRPEPSRAVQRELWRLIASGVTMVQASESVGVPWPVGYRTPEQALNDYRSAALAA